VTAPQPLVTLASISKITPIRRHVSPQLTLTLALTLALALRVACNPQWDNVIESAL
jgi:hypothetical protein